MTLINAFRVGALGFLLVGTLVLDPLGMMLCALAMIGFVVLQGVLPGERRAGRLRAGLCVHCGYDLRGTRGRCPECGRLVAPGTPVRAVGVR